MDSGLAKQDYDNIKEGNDSGGLGNHEQLKEENTQDCCDEGYEDGHIHPFEHERNSVCQEYGYHTYGMDSSPDVNQPGTQEIFVRHLLMPHDYLIRQSILQ